MRSESCAVLLPTTTATSVVPGIYQGERVSPPYRTAFVAVASPPPHPKSYIAAVMLSLSHYTSSLPPPDTRCEVVKPY